MLYARLLISKIKKNITKCNHACDDDRIAIPLCVIKHLRRRYQSADENYRCFQHIVADVVRALVDLQD